MFDEQDQELGPVLMLVIGIAIVMSLFAIGVALSVTGVFFGGASAPAAAVESTSAAQTSHVYFALAESTLPADASDAIAPMVAAALADPSRKLVLSGYHDASGDPAKNAELAKDRAVAVRDALVTAGVPEERVVLEKPQQVMGGADPKEARRVDITLR